MRASIVLALASTLALAQSTPIAPIERRIPPKGKALTEAQTRQVEMALAHLAERIKDEPERLDIAAVHKAVRFALENGEFYDPPKDLKKINDLVRVCDGPFAKRVTGIRGYRSSVDGSVQPYAVVVPEGLDLSKPVPLWIWLHGRGDKETDLHFLHKRIKATGQFQPEDAIVLHPFGRQCIGWKHAGERDVFDAAAASSREFKVDSRQIALCGFSMGGAGAWHIGAHHGGAFAAVHAGAGFAETARYTKLKKEDYPPVWEQKLWGVYDVPNYARNFINGPIIAYSGENDKQIQAARVMEEALAEHGQTLKHVIGPGMGHKYHPESAKEIEAFVSAALTALSHPPEEAHLQTRTLRYHRANGIEVTGLEKHWEDTRIDVRYDDEWVIQIVTKNVTSFELLPTARSKATSIDGQRIESGTDPRHLQFVRRVGKWQLGTPDLDTIRKSPGLQGPIDDAFMASFLVALPSAKPGSALHARWLDFEIAHLRKRWKELFRGELRTKLEHELTTADHQAYNIIAWGMPDSSPLVKSIIAHAPEHDPSTQIVAMIRPNPKNPKKYLVINSGPTFREAHDRTNSLQNPKLGDWAIIDLLTDPNAEAPGRIVASGFFDERWRLDDFSK